MCVTTTTDDESSADYGLYDSQVRDVSGSTWYDLPRCPKDMLVLSTYYTKELNHRTPLADGFLLVSWRTESYNDGLLRAARLQVSAPAVPPEVVADLPASLSLDEGTSQTFAYYLTGDIPTGGVDVVVERVSGDADVRIVDGAIQRVMIRDDMRQVRVAGLTDADSTDDSATVRVRVVQADGSIDPNARSMSVSVTDLYSEPGSGGDARADVNEDGEVNALDLGIVVDNFGITID